MSIYTGSYLVTCIKTLGGNAIFDLVKVVGGSGISSRPWQALSLITSDTYLITASMIVRESYYQESLLEAKAIFLLVSGKPPALLTKYDSGLDPNSAPVC